MNRSIPQSGFSLAETLVALFILALVSSAGATLLIGATGAGKQMRLQESEARTLDIAQRLIRQDIGAISPRIVQPTDGFSQAGNLIGESARGEQAFLRFVRSGWINPAQIEARSTLQYVEYTVRNGALVRDAWLRPDATSGTPVATRVLLENVKSVELGFERGGQRSDFWRGDVLQDPQTLPDLVEFQIIFEDNTSLILAALTGGR